MPRETSNDTTFAVVPPPTYSWWLLIAMLAIPVIVVATILAFDEDAGADGRIALAVVFVVIALVAVVMFLGMKRREVALRGDTLAIKAALFGHRVAVSALDLDKARIIDLRERTDLKPTLRTFGMTLPGYRAGWFRTRDGRKGFCLLTTPRNVAWLPSHDGAVVMLSLERPQALLQRLRDMSARRA